MFYDKGSVMKFLHKFLLLFFIVPFATPHLHATNLDFRQAENSALLTPYNVTVSVLLDRILGKLGEQEATLIAMLESLLNIEFPTVTDSSSAGTVGIYSRQGQYQNTDATTYWDHPLIINDDDSRFVNKNVVRLLENITYKPSADMVTNSPYPAAIIIDRDNVTLDLFGFSLYLDDSLITGYDEDALPICIGEPDDITRVYGIYITPGTKNVRIISSKNSNILQGAVRDFTDYAVYVDGGSTYEESIDQVLIEKIIISDNHGGIYMTNANDVIINNANINGTSGQEAIYGMNINTTKNLVINECRVTSQTGCGNIYGISLLDCISATIFNTICSFNTSLTADSYGFYIHASTQTSSYGITLDHCTANENIAAYAQSAQSAGILFADDTYNNTITNCTCLSNRWTAQGDADVVSPLPTSFGIRMQNSLYNEISANNVGTNQDYGIFDGSTTLSEQQASTNIYTKNKSFFNPTNYFIFFENAGIQALPTIILYPGDLSALNTANEIENIEIRALQTA